MASFLLAPLVDMVSQRESLKLYALESALEDSIVQVSLHSSFPLTTPSERSISPLMYPCGSDDVFCPQGSVAPIAVHTGFYTTFQWSEGCKPGIQPTLMTFPELIMPRDLPKLLPCH